MNENPPNNASFLTFATQPAVAAAGTWFIFMLLLFVFRTPLVDSFFPIFELLYWSMLLIGCVIAGYGITILWKNPLQGSVLAAVCGVGIALSFTVGFDWGRQVLFQIRKPGYEAQLAEAVEQGIVPQGMGNTELGPPKLYAFYWQRGVIDNWSGVVYDPTGRIATINEAEGWDEIRSHELSNLFGGTFYHCEDMGGGWYICWFT